MPSLMPYGRQQYFDDNGNPLAGGRIYTYEAGTSTPMATYSDAAGATPNANPVVLNARGEASIWWGDAPYKIVVKDASDVEIYTQDNAQAPIGRADLVSTSAGKGAALVGVQDSGGYYTGVTVEAALQEAAKFEQSGTGAVVRTVRAKLRDVVHALDFWSALDASYSDAINRALQYASTIGAIVQLPNGTLSCLAQIDIPSNTGLVGQGKHVTTLDFRSAALTFNRVIGNGASNFVLRDFGILDDYTSGATSDISGVYVFDCTNFEVTRVKTKDIHGTGISLISTATTYDAYADVKDCTVINAGKWGISVFRGMTLVTVEDNVINQTGGAGIVVDDGTTTGAVLSGVQIHVCRNTVRKAGQNETGAAGILASGTAAFQINGNIIHDCGVLATYGGPGIIINSGNNDTNVARVFSCSHNLIYSNNNATASNGGAIHIEGARDGVVSGNVCLDNNLHTGALVNAAEILIAHDGTNSTFAIFIGGNTIRNSGATNARTTIGVLVGASVSSTVTIGPNQTTGLSKDVQSDAAASVVRFGYVTQGSLPTGAAGHFGRLAVDSADGKLKLNDAAGAWIVVGTQV